ncbi:MAG TPA: hypothetical protein VE223_02575 [Nitrososphaeraceae archaeon]|nr:hypothetical protein [Nitrososphaeraceae archaeon]
MSVISIILLFFLHLFTITIQISPDSIPARIIQIFTIILISLSSLSVIWRGLVPVVICGLGITLIYGGIVIPSYTLTLPTEGYFKGIRILIDQQIISMATEGYFFLGIAMVVLSMIIAYKPTLLYVKNRPKPSHSLWTDYQKWYDNVQLAGGYTEPNVPLKTLMSEQEKYLLWRYEYILTSIYGTPYLVKPDGFVPKRSTILRDKESGRMIGVARYSGYFM